MMTAEVRSDPRIAPPAPGAAHDVVMGVAPADARGFAEADAPRTSPVEALAPDVVRAALERVLASETFRRSERHRLFLRYVVDATLAGKARCLKEVVIGLDVFERDLAGYDPRRDSIVRVEARRLRKKLARYYDHEGWREGIEIRLNVGSYVPVFLTRSMAGRVKTATPLVMVVPFAVVGSGDAATRISVGLADQLVDSIGSIDGLHVMAPIIAARLLDDAIAVDTLRRRHGVDYIVDGSMMQAGAQLRCALHLSSTDDGVRRWSRLFNLEHAAGRDGAASDLFAFQDRIAAAACEALAEARRQVA